MVFFSSLFLLLLLLLWLCCFLTGIFIYSRGADSFSTCLQKSKTLLKDPSMAAFAKIRHASYSAVSSPISSPNLHCEESWNLHGLSFLVGNGQKPFSTSFPASPCTQSSLGVHIKRGTSNNLCLHRHQPTLWGQRVHVTIAVCNNDAASCHVVAASPYRKNQLASFRQAFLTFFCKESVTTLSLSSWRLGNSEQKKKSGLSCRNDPARLSAKNM